MTPYEQFFRDYQGKKVLILGLGLQGRGVGDARVFAEIGAQVTVSDTKSESQLASSIKSLKDKEIRYRLGEQSSDLLSGIDLIVRNASVPWEHPLLSQARKAGISIKSDESLFFEYAKPSKVVGITGTRGKSTTTHLVYNLLLKSGYKPKLMGNTSTKASLEELAEHTRDQWYVFELSSWQLQPMHDLKWSPHVAIFTNLYPDHLLDRNMAQYAHDKSAIFAYQNPNDILITNTTQKLIKELVRAVKSRLVSYSPAILPEDWQFKLKGQHNRENLAAAYMLAQELSLDPLITKNVLTDFTGLPFRLENRGTINSVTIINDTTSTTPTATIKALETYPGSILIIGGSTKHLPYEEMVKVINSIACKVVLLSGSGTQEIKHLIKPDILIGEFDNLADCLDQALGAAEKGQVILFSPGFTSFGMFDNEFDRGRQFNKLIADKR